MVYIQGKKAVDCIVFGIEDHSVQLGAEASRFNTAEQLLPYLKSARSMGHVNGNIVGKRRNRPNDLKLDRDSVSKETTDPSIKCYNCSQYGHYKSQCTKPMLKCARCFRFGHTADKCSNNKNSVANSNSAKPVRT